MLVKKHENFDIPKKHFIFLGLLLIGSQPVAYLVDEYLMHNSHLIGFIVIFILGYGCLVFAMTFYRLYHVPCPICLGKTITKSSRKETPNSWSAFCEKCDLLWDLGIGNDD
jgi:hypothetical protein